MDSWGVLSGVGVECFAGFGEEKNEVVRFGAVLGIFPVDIDACYLLKVDCVYEGN